MLGDFNLLHHFSEGGPIPCTILPHNAYFLGSFRLKSVSDTKDETFLPCNIYLNDKRMLWTVIIKDTTHHADFSMLYTSPRGGGASVTWRK